MNQLNYFDSTTSHILAELERIDLLIRAQVARARQLHEADREFQGLYISEQEIDDQLQKATGMPAWATVPSALSAAAIHTAVNRMRSEIDARQKESRDRGITLRLAELAQAFELSNFEVDVLLICLAPELDLRYERLYAYLQDDVTKKRPSVDLVLNLLCPSFEAKLEARKYLAGSSCLRRCFLLDLFDDPSQPNPPLLGKFLKVDQRIVDYLHGSEEIEDSLQPFANISRRRVQLKDLILPARVKKCLASWLEARQTGQAAGSMIIYFQGRYGVGKQSAAEALCCESGLGLLSANCRYMLNTDGLNLEKMLRLVQREALLQKSAVYWSGFDILLAEDKDRSLDVFLQALEKSPGLVFLSGQTAWEPQDALHDLAFMRLKIPRPTYAERLQLWQLSLNGSAWPLPEVNTDELAGKFRFSGGQIKDAAATALNLVRGRDLSSGQVTMKDLYRACRLQSNRKLSTLAQKITPHYGWDDIVLPVDRRRQLRELCNYVKYHARVYEQWGFDAKLSLGKGLNALFAGPSGTGKTMAAEIMANELGLDLYKIDLSGVVSKYIGETEKNLGRIFAEAETSNAILFFDEADALFGKRSEIRDAHDRYANIEVSYLLQKMEEYQGVVILATNLRKNMDDAFVRRMHFTVDFPFPGVKDRHRIWQKIWPPETPRSRNLDLDFAARRIAVAGGNIRNIALAAAFLAADDGNVVIMKHLIRATQREYQKIGKVVTAGDFGEYAGYVMHNA